MGRGVPSVSFPLVPATNWHPEMGACLEAWDSDALLLVAISPVKAKKKLRLRGRNSLITVVKKRGELSAELYLHLAQFSDHIINHEKGSTSAQSYLPTWALISQDIINSILGKKKFIKFKKERPTQGIFWTYLEALNGRDPVLQTCDLSRYLCVTYRPPLE